MPVSVVLAIPYVNEPLGLALFRQENRLWHNLCVGSLLSRFLAFGDVGNAFGVAQLLQGLPVFRLTPGDLWVEHLGSISALRLSALLATLVRERLVTTS
jgi:hypothetical protein